jgi:hypothetical protein
MPCQGPHSFVLSLFISISSLYRFWRSSSVSNTAIIGAHSVTLEGHCYRSLLYRSWRLPLPNAAITGAKSYPSMASMPCPLCHHPFCPAWYARALSVSAQFTTFNTMLEYTNSLSSQIFRMLHMMVKAYGTRYAWANTESMTTDYKNWAIRYEDPSGLYASWMVGPTWQLTVVSAQKHKRPSLWSYWANNGHGIQFTTQTGSNGDVPLYLSERMSNFFSFDSKF